MRSILAYAIAAALTLLPSVSAHYRFPSLIVDGVTSPEYQYIRKNTNYNSPVTDVTSKDLTCNTGASSTGVQTATVAAGGTIGFAADQPVYHIGVLNVYMSKATGAIADYDGAGGWFKIYQIPAVTNGGASITFPTDNQAKFNFTIPKDIEAGEYLLRIEHIALHAATAAGGAQFYISCAHISVTGGGTATPTLVDIPGVYVATDPGLMINVYYPIPTSYTQPGPAVFAG